MASSSSSSSSPLPPLPSSGSSEKRAEATTPSSESKLPRLNSLLLWDAHDEGGKYNGREEGGGEEEDVSLLLGRRTKRQQRRRSSSSSSHYSDYSNIADRNHRPGVPCVGVDTDEEDVENVPSDSCTEKYYDTREVEHNERDNHGIVGETEEDGDNNVLAAEGEIMLRCTEGENDEENYQRTADVRQHRRRRHHRKGSNAYTIHSLLGGGHDAAEGGMEERRRRRRMRCYVVMCGLILCAAAAGLLLHGKGSNGIVWTDNQDIIIDDEEGKVNRTKLYTKKNGNGGGTFKIVLFTDLHYGENPEGPWGPVQDERSTNVIHRILDWEEHNSTHYINGGQNSTTAKEESDIGNHDDGVASQQSSSSYQKQPPQISLPKGEEGVDLVVYLGDQLTGNNLRTTSEAESKWEQLIQPTKERSIPWAFIMGNHDDAPYETTNAPASWDGRTLLNYDNELGGNLSLSRSEIQGVDGGITNFVIEVVLQQQPRRPISKEEELQEEPLLSPPPQPPIIVALLYFADTGGGSFPQVLGDDVVSWVNTTSRRYERERMRRNHRLPQEDDHYYPKPVSLLFMHIPSWEYRDVGEPDHRDRQQPLSNNNNRKCVGMAEDGIATTVNRSDIARVMADNDFSYAFVGHDHGNDWCCPHHHHIVDNGEGKEGGGIDNGARKLVNLCFARHSGYGGYGKWDRGSRVIEIRTAPRYRNSGGIGADDPSDASVGAAVEDTGSTLTERTWRKETTRPAAEVRTWVRMENGTVVHLYGHRDDGSA